jgi:hypothetical protein
MEMKVHDAAVISAHGAAAPGLGDKDPLDLLMTAGDGFADASFAPPTGASRSVVVAVEGDLPMPRAEADLRCALGRGWPAHLLQ